LHDATEAGISISSLKINKNERLNPFSMMPPNYKKRKPMITGQEIIPADKPFTHQMGEQKTIIKSGPDDGPITAKDVAEYSASVLGELRELTNGAGLKFLGYLIQVAYEEAKIQAAEHDTNT
jgi:hypothetical protein